MCHTCFIHSSVDGHLICSHVLAIVNSVAMNIGEAVSFCIMVFFGYVPRSGIARAYGNSIFSFQRNPLVVSTVATPTYIPTKCRKVSFSLYPPSICYL